MSDLDIERLRQLAKDLELDRYAVKDVRNAIHHAISAGLNFSGQKFEAALATEENRQTPTYNRAVRSLKDIVRAYNKELTPEEPSTRKPPKQNLS
jgi:hypothetical protein